MLIHRRVGRCGLACLFNFTARGTRCPTGEYSFKHQKGAIHLTGSGGKIRIFMPVVTSIARSSDADDHLLAFGKVGDDRILSEVCLPGAQGALVQAKQGEHTNTTSWGSPGSAHSRRRPEAVRFRGQRAGTLLRGHGRRYRRGIPGPIEVRAAGRPPGFKTPRARAPRGPHHADAHGAGRVRVSPTSASLRTDH